MNIESIVERALCGEKLCEGDVTSLLSVNTDADRDRIFSAARSVRDKMFGNKIFLYGFVYFSTYCKNNCSFCYYRRSNDLSRYRKTKEEVLSLSGSLQDAGVNLVDLTMGEDPLMYDNDYAGLLDLVESVDEAVDIAIMVSPGALSKEVFPKLNDAGADWFACYQETYNKDLFSKLRLEQDYDRRRNQRIWAKEAGLLTEDGMMVGLGETAADRADAILKMGAMNCEQIRAMTFVPQTGTPMGLRIPSDSTDELISIAVMRLLYPERLIPASLDVEGIAGLKTRLDAGANVITSIIPPNKDLAGVAQHELDIDDGLRSVDYVMEMLDTMGRRPGTDNEYQSFIRKHKTTAGGS